MDQISSSEQNISILESYVVVQDIVNEFVQEKIKVISKNLYKPKQIVLIWTTIFGWLYLFGWLFVFAPTLSRMITIPESFTIFRFFIFVFGVFFIFFPIALMNRWKKKHFIISSLISILWYPTATILLCLPFVVFLTGNVNIQETLRMIVVLFFMSLIFAIAFLGLYLIIYFILTTELFIFFATHLKTKSPRNLSGMVIPDEQSFISSIVHSIVSSETNKPPDLPTHGWQSILDMSAQRTDGMSIRQDTFAVLATTVSLVGVALSFMDGGFSTLRYFFILLVTLFDDSISIENTQVNWLFFGVLAVFMLFVFLSTLKIYKNSFTNEVLQKLCIYNLYEKKRILITEEQINEEQEDQLIDVANQPPNYSFWGDIDRCTTNISKIILYFFGIKNF